MRDIQQEILNNYTVMRRPEPEEEDPLAYLNDMLDVALPLRLFY